MSTTTLSVPAISCAHCIHTVQTELKLVPGVETVQADLKTKQVTLSYRDPSVLAEAKKTLAEIGYPAA